MIANDMAEELLDACRTGNFLLARDVIQRGCDPKAAKQKLDYSTISGYTPLHYGCEKGDLGFVQFLVETHSCNPHCKSSFGTTPLHLACSEKHREIVEYLLSKAQCNPNCIDSDGYTPLGLTRDPIISKHLVANGANPADLYRRHGQRLPAVSVNTFVIGDQGNGKSSLSKALGQHNKGFARLTSRVVKVTGVDEKTAGIIPYDIHSKHFGHLALYDFAGHKEYYSSNGAMIRSVTMGSTTALFLLVVNLRSSDAEFTKTITYWLHFVKTECIRSQTGPNPHVIIVGSFADKIKSKSELSRKREIVESLLPTPVFSGIHFASFVTINCCFSESSSMTDLRKDIAKSCKDLKSEALMSFNSHCFFLYLLDKYQQCTAVTLDTIHSQMQDGDRHELQESIPQTIPELCKACEDLTERGSILFVQKADDVKRSWVVLDRGALLSQVTGTVFAPEDLKEHNSTLASSTGVVPFSNIQAQFPTLDPHMVVAYMSYLEFCHEIVDREALHFLQAPTDELGDSTAQFYFFPGLVRVEAPRDVWKADPQFAYQSGWVLQCAQPHEFLTPRLVHTLLLRIAFSFALDSEQKVDHPALQRKCSVWKNGICWINRDGVECLVEVADSKRVVLMLRCLADSKLQCVRHRSLIVRKILNTLKDCCSEVSTTTAVLLPSDVSYPVESTKHPVQFTIREIAKAVMEAKPGAKPSAVNEDSKLATLEDLLYFEPYSDLGEHILKELCSKHKQGTKITDSFLRHITDRIQNKRTFIDLFKSTAQHFHGYSSHSLPCSDEAHELVRVFQLWRDQGRGTYECLTQELDNFSIFAGKNPLEIAGVHCQPTEYTPPSEQDTALCDSPTMMELVRFRGKERRINIPQEISTQCRQFGYLLLEDSTGARVQNIDETCRGNPEQMNLKILRQWLDGKGKQPVTWTTLVEILRDSELTNLAKDIEAVKLMAHTQI